jgi:hypothetical protein
MKNIKSNNTKTYAVVTREAVFVDDPSTQTRYFKDLVQAEKFRDNIVKFNARVKQVVLMEVLGWHE